MLVRFLAIKIASAQRCFAVLGASMVVMESFV